MPNQSQFELIIVVKDNCFGLVLLTGTRVKMAGIVAAKILMNKRNVKGRVESSVSKVLAILDHDRQV